MSEVCSEYEAERSNDSDEIKKKRFEKLVGLMQKVSHIQSNLHVQPLVVGDQAINSNTTHQNFLMKIGTSRKQTLLVSELILGLIIFHCFQSQPLATTWQMVCSTCSLYNYVLCSVKPCANGCNIVGQQLPALLYVPCCIPFAHPDCAKFETGQPFSPVQTYATLLGVVACICK